MSCDSHGARRSSRRDWSVARRGDAHPGFATRRGRRGALLHHDTVNGRLRGRRGARMTAITSGGAIPDNADYRVVLEPEDTFIGTVNEDFAVESMAGDIFQLGNMSWRILRVQRGTVRVEDARGQPPSIPFWLGEAPARSASSRQRWRSCGLSRLDRERDCVRGIAADGPSDPSLAQDDSHAARHRQLSSSSRISPRPGACSARFRRRTPSSPSGSSTRPAACSSCIHSPFGSRVNRAWGLALRKRFCRQFNFELQAAATEDAVLLSLGPQHSFPLETVFKFLHPDTVRDDPGAGAARRARCSAPTGGGMPPSRSPSPRSRGGRKIPPQIQRMEVGGSARRRFPDAAACLENIPGDREIPDHPLVRQTIDDCLHEVDGPRRPHRAAAPDPRGRDPVHRPRPARAVAAGARDPERQALRLPRRRAAGGAPHPGGLHPPRLRALLRRRPRRARSRGDRAGAGRGLARGAGRRRAARRACSPPAS